MRANHESSVERLGTGMQIHSPDQSYGRKTAKVCLGRAIELTKLARCDQDCKEDK